MSVKELIKTVARRQGYELRDAAYIPNSCDRKIYEYYLSGAAEIRTIFDVGANIGQTALAFSSSFPDANIYSFEPFRRIFQILQANTAALGHVQCVPLALGAAPATMEVASEPLRSDINSLLDNKQRELRDRGVSELETITVQDGASFCADHRIGRIDILKIDTEGFEIPVLEGFDPMLGPKIRSILAEFCLLENQARQTPLLALCDRLKPKGYQLVSVYDIRHEADGAFHYGNALFVHTDHLRPDRRW